MAATISILNSVQLTNLGVTETAKQGAATDAITTGYAPSVSDWTLNGTCFKLNGSLATATVNTIWQTAQDFPATCQYAHFWSDQTCYIQLVGTATNSQHKVLKQLPFVIPGFGSVLAAASTSIITGGSEPSVTALTKIVIGNYSGTTMNWTLLVVN